MTNLLSLGPCAESTGGGRKRRMRAAGSEAGSNKRLLWAEWTCGVQTDIAALMREGQAFRVRDVMGRLSKEWGRLLLYGVVRERKNESE